VAKPDAPDAPGYPSSSVRSLPGTGPHAWGTQGDNRVRPARSRELLCCPSLEPGGISLRALQCLLRYGGPYIVEMLAADVQPAAGIADVAEGLTKFIRYLTSD